MVHPGQQQAHGRGVAPPLQRIRNGSLRAEPAYDLAQSRIYDGGQPLALECPGER